MNALNRQYSIAHTDDLLKFCRSKVKVTAGLQGDNAGASRSIFQFTNFFLACTNLMVSVPGVSGLAGDPLMWRED